MSGEGARPEDLAREIGMSAKMLRGLLQRAFPRSANEHWQPWYLSQDQVLAVRARFGSRPGIRPPRAAGSAAQVPTASASNRDLASAMPTTWVRRTGRFDRASLASAGFRGWRQVRMLAADLTILPGEPGVYVVLYEGPRPRILDTSVGGRFKGRDPSVSAQSLITRLAPDTPVLYIGKGDDLRRRLNQLFRFGGGAPVGHWGGRYLWQLEGAQSFLVAWRTDPDPLLAEAELLQSFFAEFGVLPFANLLF